MDYSLISYLWFFVIYAFLGWWLEVSFQTVTVGKFINRGFLNGPVCPIYGFGMVTLLYFLSPFVNSLIMLFIGAVILTSVLEYITGFVLEKLFHDKWWDYTEMPYNLHGYICLSFSLAWGLAAVFVLQLIHPVIEKFSSLLDNRLGNFILLVLVLYFIADFIVTLFAILKIKKRLTLLDEMVERLQLYSDGIGEDIYKKTSFVVEAVNKAILEYEETKEDGEDIDIPELQDMRDKLTARKDYVHKRLEKAYPNLKEKLASFGNGRKEK